jgi:hypothetical protein
LSVKMVSMFTPYCPTHESTVLLGYESVVGIESTVFGVKVLLRCYCGELLVNDSVNGDYAATRVSA